MKVGSLASVSLSAYSKHVHLEILVAVPHVNCSLQLPCTVLPLGVGMKHRNNLFYHLHSHERIELKIAIRHHI